MDKLLGHAKLSVRDVHAKIRLCSVVVVTCWAEIPGWPPSWPGAPSYRESDGRAHPTINGGFVGEVSKSTRDCLPETKCVPCIART